MRAHYFQHVPFEGLGSIAPWLDAAGWQVTGTRFHKDAALPDLRGIDLLVIMGGPMSANDGDTVPWLEAEKAFIRRAADGGTRVLGVCLGAQLIASAMGARFYRNPVRETGWFPVQGTRAADPSAFRFPSSVDAFHWHGEAFDLPPGAVRLARSAACKNQAFQLGRSVIGLQCHLETTPEAARELVRHCRADLAPDAYVQSEAAILAAAPEQYLVINRLMDEVLAFLTAG